MNLEDRIMLAVDKAKDYAKESDAELLKQPIDKTALSRIIKGNQAGKSIADFYKTCFGLIERKHYSLETTLRLIAYAMAFLKETTKDGSLLEKGTPRDDYYTINNELQDFMVGLVKLNKKQSSTLDECKNKTKLTLDKVVITLDSMLNSKSTTQETIGGTQALKAGIIAIRVMLQKQALY